MFKSILVPLDGSEFSAQALPLAAHIARLSHATLDLVMVHQPLPVWYTPEAGIGDLSAFDDQARTREIHYMEAMAAQSSTEHACPVTATVVNGEVSSAIGEFVAQRGFDLLVMTSHGRRGLPRLWLGSVADKLIRSLNIPVLVTRPAAGGDVLSPKLRRILVPLDGSRLAQSILEDAKMLARLADAELLLVMVSEPLTHSVPLPQFQYPLEVSLESDARREAHGNHYIGSLVEQLTREGLRVKGRVIAGRGVAHQVLGLAREQQCDLIVVATHGLGGFDRLLLGSVADQLVRGASNVPVLILPPVADPDGMVLEKRHMKEPIGVPSCAVPVLSN